MFFEYLQHASSSYHGVQLTWPDQKDFILNISIESTNFFQEKSQTEGLNKFLNIKKSSCKRFLFLIF